MRILGELSLLVAFVCSGFAAFACIVGWLRDHRALRCLGAGAALLSVSALTLVLLVLTWALAWEDIRFAYVGEYSSPSLPWYYSCSALWVGQAGSLLLWAWLSGGVALLFGVWPRQTPNPLRYPALGTLMAYVWFLIAIMVCAADPMEANVSGFQHGSGLSPVLQHPAMLIHPPVVFLGYSLWAVPFALALVSLATGQLNGDWIRAARPWALFAWAVLGGGILLGAEWAYEELGWGGYWGWDPVENGSLIPWLTGTALLHVMAAWQHVGLFKKTAVSLAIATFGLCNFATFLTRSGIFSSLHAFSSSPIGWLFLVFMLALAVGGGALIVFRRPRLAPDRPIRNFFSREAGILLSVLALLLLAGVTMAGTLSTVWSSLFVGEAIMVGPAFYNNVLIPTGLLLLLGTAATPLLRWDASPATWQRKLLPWSAGASAITTVLAVVWGFRHPIELPVLGCAIFGVCALLAVAMVAARARARHGLRTGIPRAVFAGRRQYAVPLIHLGFICLTVGIAGSSLRTRQRAFEMKQGEKVVWADRQIRLAGIHRHELPDRIVGEAELEISRDGRRIATLLPAQHYHRSAGEWTTEVAIHSTWGGDFYTILHGGEAREAVRLTFVENPMMRWLWLGGSLMGLGSLVRLWPSRRRDAVRTTPFPVKSLVTSGYRPSGAAASLL
ncbi:MAG: heme lyase CcmF/NrfE family subunit [Planctomycetota bacterium]